MKLDIVKHKFIYLAISAILLIPGIIAMIYSMVTYDTHTPVKVGIDYTGNSSYQVLKKQNMKDVNVFIQLNENNTLINILNKYVWCDNLNDGLELIIDDVKKIVEENKGQVHSFIEHPDAEEYYDTLKMEKQTLM